MRERERERKKKKGKNATPKENKTTFVQFIEKVLWMTKCVESDL